MLRELGDAAERVRETRRAHEKREALRAQDGTLSRLRDMRKSVPRYRRAVSEELNRKAAERLFAAFERWELESIESLIADDAVEGRPQSGERFVGRANIMGMLRSLPSEPQISWRSIRGGPRVWVAEGIVEYGEGPVHLIGIAELEDGKMVRSDYYFAYAFEPAEWRAPFAERQGS